MAATGRHVDAEVPAHPPERFFEDADLPRATVQLGPDAQWVLDQYPIDEVTEADDGWVEARLPVTSDRWLAKLLIRLGPDATLVEPANPAVALARAMLARY